MTHNITDIKEWLAELHEDSPRPWKAEREQIDDARGSPVGSSILYCEANAIVATMNAADDMVELVETMLQWKGMLHAYEGDPDQSDPKVAERINELTGRMHALLERFSL